MAAIAGRIDVTPVATLRIVHRSRILQLLLSISLTAVIGISAYATRDDRTTAPPAKSALAAVPRGPEYVAIGDSFTAGGSIGTVQTGATDCQRSVDDYPTLVARAARLTLTDVSCVGASTRDILQGTDTTSSQIAAVTPKAKLVTVSAGGNDHGIFVNVFLNCIRYAKSHLAGSPCQNKMGQWVAARIPQVQRSLVDVLAAVQKRAPHATVMMVNYLRILPDAARCEAIPYPPGDVAWVALVERQLADAMRRAAAIRGVELIDMHAKSAGHDVCAAHPWTNGLRPKLHDGLFLHPNADGQRAVAHTVRAAWRRELTAQR